MLVAYALGVVLLRLTFASFTRGAKLSAPFTKKLGGKNPRAPIIYLRSFQSDAATVPSARHKLGMAQYLPDVRLEQYVVSVARLAGPVFALGQPGETLPQLGAARLDATSESWQDLVHRGFSGGRNSR